jgi:hypothetical protein
VGVIIESYGKVEIKATGRNFSMLGINSGHHYLSTYQILMISGNVEFLPPFLYRVLAAILKMADIPKILKTMSAIALQWQF